jgi:hypothetical protein
MKTFIIILIASAITFSAFVIGFIIGEKILQLIKKTINLLNNNSNN